LSLVDGAWQAGSPESIPTTRLRARVAAGVAARPPAVPHWNIAAAFVALAIVVVAIATQQDVSRLTPVDASPRTARNARPRPTALELETSKHLEQTQLLLRSVRNAQPDTVADLAYEREFSRELLSRNRLLRRRADQRDLRQTEELLNDIEPLLLDIANLPERPAPDEMRSLRNLIGAQHIIAELQLHTRISTP
jgi:hypothetical protein